ncbi:hypothetical protein AAJ76_9300010958 [Vairimorpha ceranae]|uniref:Uncharacterized protein n=1 Tax=Vairimorpha ceranae TaxID=40302 RepID=A0A0F9YNF3_9MICR|nr:hypothetical protein AAJ76_9300010958 [Vairimorpha ceranae]KKO74257.1 hypothetical protein AAJ76_9300010958 [Vairimorpha ceranae]
MKIFSNKIKDNYKNNNDQKRGLFYVGTRAPLIKNFLELYFKLLFIF